MSGKNSVRLVDTDQSESEDMVVRGNIDGVFHGMLAGWFYTDVKADNVELTLFVNGKPVAHAPANQPRPDVEANLGFGGNSGFSFDLLSLDFDEVITVSVTHLPTGYNFFDGEYKFSKSVAHYIENLREIFFPQYYRKNYAVGHLTNDEAFQHFVTVGIYEGFDPSPWVDSEYISENYFEKASKSMLPVIEYIKSEEQRQFAAEKSLSSLPLLRPSLAFDLNFYLSQYPDLANQKSLLGHYTQFGVLEGRISSKRFVPDHIRQELKDYLDIEPALVSVSRNLDYVVRYPFLSGSTYVPGIARQRFGDRIQVVVCVPFVTIGGADLVATHLIHAFAKEYGHDSVLLIVTNSENIEVEGWLGEDTNIFFMDGECQYLNREDKIDTLHRILANIAPEKIVNVNSNECWDLFRNYGKQLSTVLDLYAYTFCFDYDNEQRRVGYIPDYIPELIGLLTKVFCDNETIIQEMSEIYGFSHEEMSVFHTLYSPVADGLPRKTNDSDHSDKKILWASRLANQKRPDLLVDIASTLANQKFVVYGPLGNSVIGNEIANGKFLNIEYRGVYSDISELDLDEFSLYLNTSQWEGIPTLMITMSAVGMPIVTSDVGGIGELVDDSTGWIVKNSVDVAEYVTTINRALIQSAVTQEKAALGVDRTYQRHCWDAYFSSLVSSGALKREVSEGEIIDGEDSLANTESDHVVIDSGGDLGEVNDSSESASIQLHDCWDESNVSEMLDEQAEEIPHRKAS